MSNELEFEKALDELTRKITELKAFSEAQGIDLSGEIKKLEDRAEKLGKEMYEGLTAWQKVSVARHAERPTTLDYIGFLFEDFLEMKGDRLHGEDAAIVAGIAKFEGEPVTVIGHQKGKTTKENIARNFGMPHPEGYRKALRLMKQANKFGRPIVCFINTPGAYPGIAAEERGQSEAIARNLLEMAGFAVPIVCVVMGEGGSGGALALGVGNKLLMLENSFYSVISPEGAAALLWKDASLAQKAAETMKITAQDLKKLGVVDEIVPEPLGGAHKNPQAQAENIRAALKAALEELSALGGEELSEQRYEKYKAIGEFVTL